MPKNSDESSLQIALNDTQKAKYVLHVIYEMASDIGLVFICHFTWLNQGEIEIKF